MLIFMAFILAFLAVGLGSVKASNNAAIYGNYNYTSIASISDTGSLPCDPGVESCTCGDAADGSCHQEASTGGTAQDTVYTSTNGSSMDPGKHIYFNMTLEHNIGRSTQDDYIVCLVLNQSYGLPQDISNPIVGWTIVQTKAYSQFLPSKDLWTEGYNLVQPWTTDDGEVTGNHTCEWTLNAPSPGSSTDYEIMGMFKYGTDDKQGGQRGQKVINGSKLYRVDVAGIPEFPLGLIIPLSLSLLVYTVLRRQTVEEGA